MGNLEAHKCGTLVPSRGCVDMDDAPCPQVAMPMQLCVARLLTRGLLGRMIIDLISHGRCLVRPVDWHAT